MHIIIVGRVRNMYNVPPGGMAQYMGTPGHALATQGSGTNMSVALHFQVVQPARFHRIVTVSSMSVRACDLPCVTSQHSGRNTSRRLMYWLACGIPARGTHGECLSIFLSG